MKLKLSWTPTDKNLKYNYDEKLKNKFDLQTKLQYTTKLANYLIKQLKERQQKNQNIDSLTTTSK